MGCCCSAYIVRFFPWLDDGDSTFLCDVPMAHRIRQKRINRNKWKLKEGILTLCVGLHRVMARRTSYINLVGMNCNEMTVPLSEGEISVIWLTILVVLTENTL